MSTVQQFDESRFTGRIWQLRRSLRTWLAIRGLSRWLLLVLAILLVDMVIDRWFRMDVPQRTIMLLMIMGAGLWMGWRLLVRPLSRRITDDALVLEVERRNPRLAEAIISGFQLLKGSRDDRNQPYGPRYSEELASETIRRGIEEASGISFDSVLDKPAGRRNLLLLSVGTLAVLALALGVLGNTFLQTWFQRNILLGNEQWPRSTELKIIGATNGEIIVARGIDYRQMVEVMESSRVQDVEVDLEIDNAGTRMIQRMKPTGKLDGREHAFVFQGIAADCRIRAIGGDDTTPWVELKLVDPPAVESIEILTLLPEWTGRDTELLPPAGPYSLLGGSGISMKIRTNKEIETARLVRGSDELDLAPVEGGEREYGLTIPRADSNGTSGVTGGKYSIRLMDSLNLANIRESAIEFRLRENQAPVIRNRLLGISGLAVPNARIPVEWSATDDYGIASMNWELKWADDSGKSGERQFPVEGFSGAMTQAEIEPSVAVVELQPLGLEPGMTLRMIQTATDYALPESGKAASREYLIRIVTPEELLSDLLRREIEQRGVFQLSYDRQLELNSELKQAVAAADMTRPESIRELESRLLALYRVQRTIGTQVTTVADRFEEFLVEVANNRLDDETMAIDPAQTIQIRFESGIIDPIRDLDERLISQAALGLDVARRQMADAGELKLAVEKTAATQELVLEQMQQVLSAMQSSENFQEAVNRLLEIRRIQQQINRNLDKSSEGKDDLFDPLGGKDK